MNKNIRYITILIIGSLVLGGYGFVKNFNSTENSYKKNIELGDKAYKKEIYIDAIEYYDAAIEIDSTQISAYMKLADSYLKLGNTNQYETVMKSAMEKDDTNSKPFVNLAKYYASSQEYDKAFEVLKSADNVNNTKEVKALIKEYSSYYKDYGGTYTQIKQWKDGYLPVQIGDFWGLINSSGELAIDIAYNDIGAFNSDESVTPVKFDKDYYYINEEGYKKLVGDHAYDYLGTFNDGYAPAGYNGKYGWIDREFNEYKMNYDFVTPFRNGVAAVKKDKKWALVNDDFEEITKFIYSDIKLDENGFCSTGGYIFVKENKKYYLIDTDMEKIGNLQFEDAKPFVSEQYAAVKNNDKWGYVNTDGKLVIRYKYSDANSFSNGVAGVKKKGKWGLMKQNEKMVLDPMFNGVSSMNKEGILFVKNENYWQCIQLYAYMNYE